MKQLQRCTYNHNNTHCLQSFRLPLESQHLSSWVEHPSLRTPSEWRELIRESEQYLAWNEDSRGGKVSSSSKMHLAKQRPPGVRTDLGWSPGSHTDAGICLVGSLNHSALALGLCAAASEYLDFRAARETSVGEPESLLCPCREETLPGNLPWRAQWRSARWRRSTVLRRAVCALVCSLGSLRMSPFCHSNCSLFAEQAPRGSSTRSLSGC